MILSWALDKSKPGWNQKLHIFHFNCYLFPSPSLAHFPSPIKMCFFFLSSDCSLFDSRLQWKCFISIMQKWNRLHLKEGSHWGRGNNQNTARASEEYKLQLRTKEMEINGRICRFFWQLDTQIIFWEFSLCCLCQVKITTVQGNIKCSRLKRGHSITPTYLCVKVFQNNQ